MFMVLVPYYTMHPLVFPTGDVTLVVEQNNAISRGAWLIVAAMIAGFIPSWRAVLAAMIAGFIPSWRAVRETILDAIWGD
jgi:ABC-type antimicrobial peptide transport system permease subunit